MPLPEGSSFLFALDRREEELLVPFLCRGCDCDGISAANLGVCGLLEREREDRLDGVTGDDERLLLIVEVEVFGRVERE